MRVPTILMLLASLTAGQPLAATTTGGLAVREASRPPLSVSDKGESDPTRWIGPEGVALPFRDDAETLEFLRSAAIVSARPIGKGVNNSLKVLLEQDGVRAHAVFRRVSERKLSDRRPGSKHVAGFRDSCFFEPAAYQLGRLLGVRRIPPVVARRYGGQAGTLQLWVEDAFDERARLERGLRSPHPARWRRQKNVRRVFDALIHNIDRNQGNLLIDRRWNVWLIDHTRSFLPESDLVGRERITRCDRDLWLRLSTADRQAAARQLEPYLTPRELRSLLIRWQKLVEHIEGLIAENGAGSVLF